MVLFAVKKENEIITYIEKGKKMGISILSEGMLDESDHFANIKLMKAIPIFYDVDEVKILKGSIAWYSVSIRKTYDEGDHKIIICEIIDLDIKSNKNPLVYYRGYRKISRE